MPRRALSSVTLCVGSMKFPVKIYAARSERDGIRFSMLSPRGNRVRQYWRDEVTGEEVPRDAVLSGFEYESGKFLKLTAEEMSSFATSSDPLLGVSEFVPLSSVDRVHVSEVRSVDLVTKDQEIRIRFEALVHELEATNRVGIVHYVSRGKARLGALRAYSDRLYLDELYYGDEIVPAGPPYSFDESDPRALEVTKTVRDLIEVMSSPRFNVLEYKDYVTESLREKLTRKMMLESQITESES